MPALESHQSTQITKMILLGDSGAGKTGSLASLAAAGYNLRIIDVDSGLDVLSNLLRDPKTAYGKEALGRVVYETITDPMKNVNGKLIPARATVWQRVVKLLDNWSKANGASNDFGPISTWTNKEVLVIDSLTMLANAAMNFALSMNNRLGQAPHQSDWYVGQQLLESLLQMLYDEGIKCNVILVAHVIYMGEDNAPQIGHPQSLGRALSPKIGRYFNTMLMAKSTGAGAGVTRKIFTTSLRAGMATVELKNTAPTRVKPDYPLETGLADYFRDVREMK